MNRLTEIVKSEYGHDQIYYTPKYGNPITPIDMTDWGYNTLANHLYDILNRLKRYEDLEEQGLLIKLPCKVRDTVYVDAMTFGTRDDIEYAEAEVVSIRIAKKQTFVKLRIFALGLDGMPYGCKNYPVSSFGKTVFLTQEEAEKALEERK